MEIIPPQVLPVSREQYFSDLKLREEADLEAVGERRERLNLLFHPARVSPE